MNHVLSGGSKKTSRLSFKRKPLAFAVHLIFVSAVFVLNQPTESFAQGTTAATQNAALDFNIPAGDLASALRQVASQAGVILSFTPEQTQGKQTSGLQGRHTVQQALNGVLLGSRLKAERNPNGSYSLYDGGTEPQSVLPAVTVTGAFSATTEGTGEYGTRAASLMKGTMAIKDIPQSVTVITRQQIDDQKLDTLPEVLANTPGIYLWKRPNGGSDIYMRGFTTDSLQYDGVPIKRFSSFGNDMTISAVYLDRVEIMRGAQGLLEGIGSPAGSVNLVRKRGTTENRLSVEGRAGSWDNYGTRIDAGGPLNQEGTLRGRAVLDYEDKKSFIDNTWDRNLNAYAALDMDISADTTIGIGLAHARLRGNSSTYSGLLRYTDGRAVPLPRSASIAAPWNEAQRDETQLFFDLEHRIDQNWKFKFAGTYIDEKWSSTSSSSNGLVAIGGTTVSGVGFSYNNAATNLGLDANLSGKLDALGMQHDVVIGANYAKQKRDDHYLQYWNYTTYNIFAPNNPLPLSNYTPSDSYYQTYDIEQKGIYGLWRTHLTDRTTWLVGGRYGWYDYGGVGTSEVYNSVSASSMKDSGRLTPYTGLVYAVTPQWSVYGSYAKVFNPQSEVNAQKELLPAMSGEVLEVGIKGELLDGALNTSLAIFRADQKNRAVTDFVSPAVCGPTGNWECSKAAGKVRSEGVEIEAHGKLTNNWQVSGGYTYTRNEYLEDDNVAIIGKPFDYLGPRHMLRLWSNYQLPVDDGRWTVGGGANYRSEQRTASTTRINPVQGGYAIWNARIGYQINKTWSAALNINNLFDKHYYSFISPVNYFYSHVGEPRRFMLTVRAQY